MKNRPDLKKEVAADSIATTFKSWIKNPHKVGLQPKIIFSSLAKAKSSFNFNREEDRGCLIDPTKLKFTKLGTVIETTYQDKIEDVAEGGQLYVYYVVAVDNEGTESAGTNYVNVNVGVSKTQSMNQY